MTQSLVATRDFKPPPRSKLDGLGQRYESVSYSSSCRRGAQLLEKRSMRRRWVWMAAALAAGVGAIVLVFGVPRSFSVVHPARDLRSYSTLPPALAQPGFRAGPILAGLSVDQELVLSPRDAAIRLWVSPARAGDPARVRIELLAGPRGPSLRSGEIDVTSGSEALVARLAPPLREHEVGTGGRVLLRIAPTADSAPVQVGMAPGRLLPAWAGVHCRRADRPERERYVRGGAHRAQFRAVVRGLVPDRQRDLALARDSRVGPHRPSCGSGRAGVRA